MPLDLGGELPGVEAKRPNVIVTMVSETGQRCLHEGDERLEAVGHVHHRQHSVLTEKAGIPPVFDGLVENLHGVVRRAPARRRDVAYDTRKPGASDVDAVLLEVVVPQQLAHHLGDPVHRPGLQDRLLWGQNSRSLRPEGGD